MEQNSDLKKLAEKLRKETGYYGQYIDAPDWLLNEEEGEDLNRAIFEARKPFWNSFVNDLRSGRYGDLIRLRDTLEETRDGIQKRIEEIGRIAYTLRAHGLILTNEAQKHGRDTTLWDSFGWQGVSPRSFEGEYGWNWQLQGGGWLAEEGSNQIRKEDVYYSLRLNPEYAEILKSQGFQYDERDSLTIKATSTWGKELARLSRRLEMLEEDLPQYQKREQMVRFRLDILREILKEYELIGYVRLHEEIDPEKELDQVAIHFIKAGLGFFDESPDDFKNRRQLLKEVCDNVRGTYSHPENAEDYLSKRGLYEKAATRGRLGKSREKEALVKMVDVWRQALKGMERIERD